MGFKNKYIYIFFLHLIFETTSAASRNCTFFRVQKFSPVSDIVKWDCAKKNFLLNSSSPECAASGEKTIYVFAHTGILR